MRDYCRECGRATGYLLQSDETLPGLVASLKGEGGEAWRVFVTIAVCVLGVLLLTGLAAVLHHA